LDALRRRRIDAAQHAVQERVASTTRNALETLPKFGITSGTGKESARQRTVVEAGAADHERQSAARDHLTDDPARILSVLRSSVLARRINDVDQMMRDAATLGRRHLVGADVEAAVDGCRVAVDDLAAVALGSRERERALSGRRRSEDRDQDRQ
jgi:hypothetical protein